MSTNSSPNAEELKKYLKDAGMFEENMNYDDMLNYYKVLKCSENTAQQEQQQRNITEDLEHSIKSKDSSKLSDDGGSRSSFLDNTISDEDKEDNPSPARVSPKLNKKIIAPKSCKSKFSLTTSEETSVTKMLKNNNNNNSIHKDERSMDYDVFDSPALKHKPLDIILYERKYDLPPYCNPKFNNLSISQRAKIICNFHKAILDKFYKLHCESLNPAPWGKPIPASDKFSGNLDRKSGIDDELDFLLSNDEENAGTLEIYTSRSGRQTKRKLYTDVFEEEEEDSELKKSKKDVDKPFEIEKKPVTKRQYINKLSNQDIMKKSKLFAEPVKSTRSEKLFDLLKDNENKKEIENKKENEIRKENENKIVVDQKTDNMELTNEDSDEVIQNSQESQGSSDEVEFVSKLPAFIPRRVPPPLRGRRSIGRRQAASADTTKSNGSPYTTPTPSKSASSSPAITASEPKQKSMTGKTKCPICSQIFFQEEIEAHASSCGLGMETESKFDLVLPSGSAPKINCNVCDKEFILNKDYEVHVNDCISKQKRNGNI